MLPPNGADACWYWPATPGTKWSGSIGPDPVYCCSRHCRSNQLQKIRDLDDLNLGVRAEPQ